MNENGLKLQVLYTVLSASKNIVVLCIVLGLTGCLNNPRFSSLESPERTSSTKQPTVTPTKAAQNRPNTYQVKGGDTLYSIAFRFGMDYRKLAAANDIDQSYRIFQGQTLVLAEATPKSISPVVSAPAVAPSNSTPTTQNKAPSQEIGSSKGTAIAPRTTNISWVWPHNGKIVRTFSSDLSTSKGIDLSGRIGDSVLAAASGTVVYAGSGLPGYGNLIIIEHPNSLLSAYAYNQEILVKEKEQVAAKQVIAKMGKQGDQPRLHFEIRQNGKPVDPIRFLPSR